MVIREVRRKCKPYAQSHEAVSGNRTQKVKSFWAGVTSFQRLTEKMSHPVGNELACAS